MNLHDKLDNIIAATIAVITYTALIWAASGEYHRLEQNVQLSQRMDVREQAIDKELDQRITKLEFEKCLTKKD